jgi:hypothetical protein
LVPKETRLDANIQFESVLPTLLLPEPRPHGSVDVFIDDAIQVILDRGEFLPKGAAAIPLAVEIISRPYDAQDTPQREHMIALNKLEAEGGAKECQIILGWEIDTRRLLIKLPIEKYIAWSTDLTHFYDTKQAKHAALELMIGRLNTCIGIIPLSRFFLGDLRRHINRKSSRWKTIWFSKVELNILSLWQHFLRRARDGINLNLLSTRTPTNITITDA